MARKQAVRREPLDPQRIYQAALDFMDVHGVDELSMRKLAALLDVDAMAIYHHVPGKQALLQGVYQVVLEELPLEEHAEVRWQDALRTLGMRFYRLAQRHPRIFPYLLSSQYGTPRELEIYQFIQQALRRTGLSDQDRLYATRALYTFAIGLASAAPTGLRLRPLYGEDSPSQPCQSSEDEVAFSIDLLIAGIERWLEER
ncbi:MAG: TetR/AcrR family transcriptional regulator C-terminal domain-containing protein [Ectothiorhodospiraceae bacterium]|nr:TetR/AcrR family transcriptional regulator C-terminal domain-containing protein [Ectothiorhodospiraceae bacterium]